MHTPVRLDVDSRGILFQKNTTKFTKMPRKPRSRRAGGVCSYCRGKTKHFRWCRRDDHQTDGMRQATLVSSGTLSTEEPLHTEESVDNEDSVNNEDSVDNEDSVEKIPDWVNQIIDETVNSLSKSGSRKTTSQFLLPDVAIWGQTLTRSNLIHYDSRFSNVRYHVVCPEMFYINILRYYGLTHNVRGQIRAKIRCPQCGDITHVHRNGWRAPRVIFSIGTFEIVKERSYRHRNCAANNGKNYEFSVSDIADQLPTSIQASLPFELNCTTASKKLVDFVYESRAESMSFTGTHKVIEQVSLSREIRNLMAVVPALSMVGSFWTRRMGENLPHVSCARRKFTYLPNRKHIRRSVIP